MSFILFFVLSSSCIPVHVSRTCSCDSTVCAFTAFSILVFPPEVVLHVQHSCSRFEDGGCLNYFMYFGRSPVFQFVFSRRNCIRLYFGCYVGSIISVVGLIYLFLVLCRVSLMCSLILVVVSFHPPVVFVSITLVVIFSGCLCSLFSHVESVFCDDGSYVEQPCLHV